MANGNCNKFGRDEVTDCQFQAYPCMGTSNAKIKEYTDYIGV